MSITFVLDCCDKEVIFFVVKKERNLPAWMVQEHILLALNRRSASVNPLPPHLQLLTDNDSAYISQKTNRYWRLLVLRIAKPSYATRSSMKWLIPFKRDYPPFIDIENPQTDQSYLPEIIERWNRVAEQEF